MKKSKYDAIVIGAGHNGLTHAAFLAKAGLDVVVLEANSYVGGASVSREIHPGFTYSNCSYVCSLFRPEIYRALNLASHGLQVIPYAGSVTFARNGDYLGKYPDPKVRYREFARHSKKDAAAYDRYARDVAKQCRFIRSLLLRTPPDPTSWRPRDVVELVFLLRKFVALGERDMADTLRFYTLSVADYLNEYFESDLIKAHLAGSGIIGTGLGVYSPGTAYVLLHHYMGDVDGQMGAWGFARGGMGAIAGALAGAVAEHGGEIVVDAAVSRILVRDGRASGVVLANGDEIEARTVISNLDPKRTFLSLLPDGTLPDGVYRQVRRYKTRGSSGKLNIALDAAPSFPALGENNPLWAADMHFTDCLERLERAYDDYKAGLWSRDPYLDMVIPSKVDPTMAPPGKHFMSVFVQYVPAQVEGGAWSDKLRDEFRDTVLDQIGKYSPDFKSLIRHVEVRTPRELEAEVGLTEGNIFQGELTLDQLFFNRPFPGVAQYRTPLQSLYLCGSATHPGGGVMAAPGANSAREVLADLRRKSTVPMSWPDD